MTSPLKGREGGVKNGILRRFLGLKLRRQGEGGGSRNPKIEETSFMDVPLSNSSLWVLYRRHNLRGCNSLE